MAYVKWVISWTISLAHTHRQTLEPKLLQPAARALSVSASTAQVERVFSQSDITLKSHRARLSRHIALQTLSILKCNNRSNMQ